MSYEVVGDVVRWKGKRIKDATAATFEVLAGHLARDENRVFALGKSTKLDPKTVAIERTVERELARRGITG